MAFTYKLGRTDGTPADPPTFRSSAGTSWEIGGVLYLGRRTFRVVAVRKEDADQVPTLIIRDAFGVGARGR